MKNTIVQYDGTKLNLKKVISEYTIEPISQLSYLDINLKEADLNKVAKNKWEITYNNGFNDDLVANLTDIFGKQTKYTGINPSVHNTISIEVLGATDNVLLIQANKQDLAFMPDSDMFLDYQQVDFFAVNRLTNEIIHLNDLPHTHIALKNVYDQKDINFLPNYRQNALEAIADSDDILNDRDYQAREEQIHKEFDEENQALENGFDENVVFYVNLENFEKGIAHSKQKFLKDMEVLKQ